MSLQHGEGLFGLEGFAGLAVVAALGLLVLRTVTGNKAKKPDSKKQG